MRRISASLAFGAFWLPLALGGEEVAKWQLANYVRPSLSLSSLRRPGFDPPLGSQAPKELTKLVRLPATFVVWSSCDECSLVSVKDYESKYGFYHVFAGTDAPRRQTTKPWKTASDQLLDALHVSFSPRVYAVGADNSITFVQPQPCLPREIGQLLTDANRSWEQ